MKERILSEELIAEVKECCEKHRPIGADVTVVSAEEISIKICTPLAVMLQAGFFMGYLE